MEIATKEMFNLGLYDTLVHNEWNTGRQKLDNIDEKTYTLKTLINSFSSTQPEVLQNIATKDLTTTEIQNDLLCAA